MIIPMSRTDNIARDNTYAQTALPHGVQFVDSDDNDEQITFRELCLEWWHRHLLTGSKGYAAESMRRLVREVFPYIGDMYVRDIRAKHILRLLRLMEERGTYVAAHKVRSHISQTLRYGIACGYLETNPARDLSFAMYRPVSKPRPAILDPHGIGVLMARIEHMKDTRTKNLLRMAAMTFVRPGELVSAAWGDIDMNNALWKIPAHKMKMNRDHLVPLATQAVNILKDIRGSSYANDRWVFPSKKGTGNHCSSSVIRENVLRLGYNKGDMSGHGFRALAATALSDLGFPSDLIEMQLSHFDSNRVRAVYQRSDKLVERGKMLQHWANWLDMQCALAMLGRYHQVP